jgi:HTH-type transcriptional regulator/antitoxin HigA
VAATGLSKTKRRDSDTYMALVRRFPLRPVKNDEEHEAAVGIVGGLIGHKLDAGAGDYLDTLILLVNKYEDEHHQMPMHATPQEALRAVMRANGLNQKQIGQVIGSESAVSMFLKGERHLSKSHIKLLAERFKLDPLLFF